ncbi:MAG TPA: pitrilysin family protein [Bacteroidota bacterium]|nr:pitrilysin family protein [Bacteroidota bacterium]
MQRLGAIVAMLVFLLAGARLAVADSIFPYAYRTEVLPNGLKIIMVPMDSPGLVAYYSIVRTGSRDEVEPGKSGFAHFFEHMMFRGTKNYPAGVYDSIITSIGADANAYTTDDYTAFHLNFATEDLKKVIELESDRFQNLYYEKPAFQTEAGAVYGEYRKSITSPYAVLEEKMQDLAYDVHTYKHTTIGFEADIKAMPEQYDYSLSFFHRFYRPENVVIVIAGDFDEAKVMEWITNDYGAWQPGYKAPAVIQEPEQHGPRSAEVTYPGKTLPIVEIGYKGAAFDPASTQYVAAMLLGELAFGETSDLYKKLYIKEQKVEFIQANIPMNRDVPLFAIYSMVKNAADIPYVEDEVYKTIQQYQTTPVSTQRLGDLTKRLKYSFLMHLDTPDHVAGGVARIVALTGGLGAIDRLYTTMAAITPQDIIAAAREFFVPDHRTVVVVKGAQS